MSSDEKSSDEVRIVHAADLHLDSPLRGLTDRLGPDLADVLRAATRRAFDNLVEHCLATAPDALVLAGDLYDDDWADYSTGSYFTRAMRRLDDAGVPVVVVQGNHDAASVITRSLTLPPNVHLLATDRPETVELGGLAVHGQGFAARSVPENLVVGYPAPVSGLVNVGVLHTSLGGGYVGHDDYAPCSVTDLTGRGYEYVALGHIHQRTQIAAGPTTAWFSGNLQGRHARETGAKGALEVVLRPGGVADVTFVPLDVARWERLEVDVSSAEDAASAYDLVDAAFQRAQQDSQDRPVVARVRLTGQAAYAATLADRDLLRHEVEDRAAHRGVAVESVGSSVRLPADRRQLPEDQRAALLAILAEVGSDIAALRTDPTLAGDLTALTSEVNVITRRAGLDLASDDRLAELAAQAAQRVLARAESGLL
jgi:DNA repair exonuclease SbcCD nuclease subunit